MTGQKTWITWTILLCIVSSLLILSGFMPARVEIPTVAQSRQLSPPEPVVLTDARGEYPLGPHMDILEDPGGQLTIEDVSSPGFDARFTPSQVQNPVYGFTDSAYWVRLELDNETSRTTNWVATVNFANMHYVDLYTPLPSGGGFSVKQSGTLRPVSARDYIFPRIAFGLMVPTHTQQTYYLRFKNGASMTLGVTLWTMREFVRQSQQELLLYGFFFGALAALLAYHIFLLLTIREPTYLFFVILLASLLITLLVYYGHMAAYVLPNVYAISLYAFPVTNALSYLSMGLFSSAFLELKTRQPRLYWVNMGVAGVWGVMILLTFLTSFGNFAQLQTTWILVTLVVILVSGLVSWWKGFHPVTIFLISWLVLAMSLILLELVRKGYVPSFPIAENSFQVALMVMVVGWSMALADRINELKANTETAIQELQNGQRELAQILDGVPLGIVVYGKDQMPRYVNEWASEILSNPARGIQPGLRARRTLAQAINHYSLHVAGTNVKYPLDKFPIFRALKGQPSAVDDLEADLVDRRIPIEMWASPVKDKVGNIEAAVAAFQDITHRKQAEAELEAYRKRLEIMVEERTRDLQLHVDWLSAINEMNQTVARSADFRQIYSRIIEIINVLFAAQDSFIAELDQNGGQLRILAHSCQKDNHAALIGSLTTLPDGTPDHSSLRQGGFAVMTRDQVSRMDGPFGEHVRISELQGIVGSPLQVREQIVGFLGLEMREADRTLTNAESNLLNIFSTDIAQVMENARLVEQAKMSMAEDERNRIARELHDSVAQALYAASLYADAIRLALQANKPQSITDNLEELIQSTRDAMADMRLLIFQLRPPVLNEGGLLVALQSRLESVEGRAGFKTHLLSEGELDLSADQETELYWIAQEILNNVIKHAHASQVKVQLMGEADCIRLVVEDDGVGFDPVVGSRVGGQGIRNIRERAEKIGAKCWIESAPSQGTTVTIEVNK